MSDFKTSSKVSFMTKRADQALKFYVSHFNRGLQQTFDEDSSFFLKMCTIKHTYWRLGKHLFVMFQNNSKKMLNASYVLQTRT